MRFNGLDFNLLLALQVLLEERNVIRAAAGNKRWTASSALGIPAPVYGARRTRGLRCETRATTSPRCWLAAIARF